MNVKFVIIILSAIIVFITSAQMVQLSGEIILKNDKKFGVSCFQLPVSKEPITVLIENLSVKDRD